MVNTKENENKKTGGESRVEDGFRSLPLDEKLASLFRMEVLALNEAVTYVIDNPGKAIGKVGDIIADWGKRLEAEIRQAVKKEDASAKGSDEKSQEKTAQG